MVDAPTGYAGCGISVRESADESDDAGINGLKLKVCSITDQSDS